MGGAETELQSHPSQIRPCPSAELHCSSISSGLHICNSNLSHSDDPHSACFRSLHSSTPSAMAASSQCSCLSCQNRFCSLDCSPVRHNIIPVQSHVRTLPDGEPLYKTLLRPRHSAQYSFADYVSSPCNRRPLASGISSSPSPLSCEFEESGSHGFSSPIHDKLSVKCPLSRGTNCYSYGDLSNEVTLYRWYLTRPVGYQTSGIGVGGFLSTRAVNGEGVETAAIIKRLEERKLLTQSGVVVNLIGTIDDCATLANGFSIQMVHLFLSGFPHVWSLLVGTMSGSVSVERDSNICGKIGSQSLVFESKEKLLSTGIGVGNRDHADAEDDYHPNNVSKSMLSTPKTREFSETTKTSIESSEKYVLDAVFQGEMEHYIEKKCSQDTADILTGTGIHTKTLNDAKHVEDEILATTSGLNMGIAVDTCGNLNKIDIPYAESPSIDACEIENDGEQTLSQSHSLKRRKIGFQSESDSPADDASPRKKSLESLQFVHPEVSEKGDLGFESILPAIDKVINTKDQKRTIVHKKKIAKKGKQRKKTRFICMRRSIKHKVSKRKTDNGKDQLGLHEGKKIMQCSEKKNDENGSGKDQHAPSNLNQCMYANKNSIVDDEIQQTDKEEEYDSVEASVSSEAKSDKENDGKSEIECDLKVMMESCISRNSGSTINSPEDACSVRDPPIDVLTKKLMKHMLPPPLPLPTVSVSKQLVSKAFGLKTSRSGRLLVPPLAHWRNQSIIRDSDGGIIAIQDGSNDTMRVDTGVFNFKPPVEARAKKLRKWLSVTAAECFTKRLKSRKKRCTLK